MKALDAVLEASVKDLDFNNLIALITATPAGHLQALGAKLQIKLTFSHWNMSLSEQKQVIRWAEVSSAAGITARYDFDPDLSVTDDRWKMNGFLHQSLLVRFDMAVRRELERFEAAFYAGHLRRLNRRKGRE